MLSAFEAEILEEHAEQAASLWRLRDLAVRDSAYGLPELCELDDRLEAHVDGLRLGGDAGWEACRAQLEEAEGGEVFAAALLAVERWDLRGVARVIDVGGGAPDLARGIVSALGWTPLERVQRLLPGLLAGRCPPALQWLGIAASAAHRHDPGAPLGYAILSDHPRLRSRALRAAGELGRLDLLPEVRGSLTAEDDGARFWAAWTAALFGDTAAAQPLWAFATGGGPFAARAACMAMRRMDPGVAYSWLHALEGMAQDRRVPIAAAAALGDPAVVPWLVEQMRAPETARFAGWAMTMITGLDLEAEGLEAAPPEGSPSGPTEEPEDEDVSMDPDESLSWPDVDAVADWWQRNAGRFRRGTRHLLGQPMAPEWLEQVLRSGRQPAREGAALELAMRQRGRKVYEVRAPCRAQRPAPGYTV